jgi:hypothetical protein
MHIVTSVMTAMAIDPSINRYEVNTDYGLR